MKNTFLLLLFAALAALANGQATIINENIQNWTDQLSYGNYTQSITVGSGTGTVTMTNCVVDHDGLKPTSGYGTDGYVALHGTNGVLTLPEVSSISTITFHLNAAGPSRSVTLQKWNEVSASWEFQANFSNIGTTGVQAISTINSSIPTTLRLTNPSNNIFVYDIIVKSNDQTSIADAPTSQPAGSDIQSTNTGSSIDVFKFKLTDKGTSDTYATKVTQVRVKKTSGTADLSDHISGAELFIGEAPVTTQAVSITDESITFPITSGNLDIPNNSSIELTLKISIKTTGIADNSTLAFGISQTDHGFTADPAFSGFAPDFGAAVSGNTFTFRVVATQLTFTQQPPAAACPLSNLSPAIVVSATDENGNVDAEFVSDITLTNSASLTTTNHTVTAISGVSTFTNFQFTQTGTTTVSATGGSLTSATASEATTVAVGDVTNPSASVSYQQSVVSWDNNTCSDEVMIVAKSGSAVTALPSGNGSAYTANSAFGSGAEFDGGYVVYKGSTSPQTITALTNGTTYYFTLFNRKGTFWSTGVTTSATPTELMFRSATTGNWTTAAAWETSPNGTDWSAAASAPTEADATITIRNGHTITVSTSVTLDQVVIEAGGTLLHTAGTLIVANGVGDDVEIKNGGVFEWNFSGNPPEINGSAKVLVKTGGMIRISNSGMTDAGTGVNGPGIQYENGSILEYTPTYAFSAYNVTYFPSVNAETIPIFRITSLTGVVGTEGTTTINGVLEANSSFSWQSGGAKVFRNGIKGTGNLIQTNGCGQWIINGSNAEIGGTGQITLSTTGITIAESTQATITSHKTISDGKITIAGGAKLTINPFASLDFSGTLTNNAGQSGIVVKSGGSLRQSTSNIAATVEQSIEAASWSTWDDGWHLLSSPVASQSIAADGAGFVTSGDGNDYDFYAWSEPNNLWINYKNSSTEPTFTSVNGNGNFTVGKGYLVAYQQSGTKQFKGYLNVNNVSVSGLTKTNSSTTRAWHLLGNPYSCPITWDNTWTRSNVGAVCQVWSETLKDYSAITTGNIPVNNGFMVEVSADNASLTIPASKRTVTAANFYKNAEEPALKITVMASDSSSGKECVIRFNELSTTSFDAEFDGHYLKGYGPEFYALAGSEQLTVNTLPVVTNDLEIPLVFKRNNREAFFLIAEGVETLGAEAFLHDNQTGILTNLRQTPRIGFSSSETDSPNRFSLKFGSVGADQPATRVSPRVYSSHGQLVINNLTSRGTIQLVSITGQVLMTVANSQETTLLLTPQVPRGIYLVRIISPDYSGITKIML
ncbi:MAG: T9SS type A sorting domain-containing protein [Bacteroidales bacterium]|nr:T9SS type A sorting domain-containing protein [Bacteroidales bacterium]MDD3666004.1 T9SS type A sorting domain-containing protein [Bacteroidales bacterium]